MSFAVAQLEGCSGVLVGPETLLTSAHCVERPVARIVIRGRPLGVVWCEKDPAYTPFEPQHDLGVCKLAAPSTGAIAIEDHADLAIGRAVSLAGYGKRGAFESDPEPRLRSVDSKIVGRAHGTFQVGTTEKTACLGDSGGPVLAESGGAMRVIGIMHGPTSAICASPVDVTPVPVGGWLADVLGRVAVEEQSATSRVSGASVALIVAAVVALGLFAVRRSRSRP